MDVKLGLVHVFPAAVTLTDHIGKPAILVISRPLVIELRLAPPTQDEYFPTRHQIEDPPRRRGPELPSKMFPRLTSGRAPRRYFPEGGTGLVGTPLPKAARLDRVREEKRNRQMPSLAFTDGDAPSSSFDTAAQLAYMPRSICVP